jgi:hypothetical protein
MFKRGQIVYLKCRECHPKLTKRIIKSPCVINGIRPAKSEVYLVGDNFGLWVGTRNTPKDPLWVTTR